MNNEFTCGLCGETFTKMQSDEAAEAEYAEVFPGLEDEDRAVVCEDCYRKMGFA